MSPKRILLVRFPTENTQANASPFLPWNPKLSLVDCIVGRISESRLLCSTNFQFVPV